MERKQSEEWQSRAARTLNSTACFSLAYVLITYLLWFATGFIGKLYKLDSFVYYYGIKFLLNGHAWNKAKVTVVYSSGPVFVLLAALLALYLYVRGRHIRSILNVFLLWVFIIGISVFMSQFIMAAMGIRHYTSIYYQGLAVCFTWLKVPMFVVYVLNAIVLLLIIYAGVNCARPFLQFSFSYSKVNNLVRRRKYFFETALVPFIVGSLATVIAIFPKELSAKNILVLLGATHIVYLAVIGVILGIAWLSMAYIEMGKQELGRYKTLQTPNVVAIVVMIVSWVIVYITFRGIYLSN